MKAMLPRLLISLTVNVNKTGDILKKNLTIGIMQPYLFPYIGYWQLIYIVDTFVILDDVNYMKKGFINRNSILINGEANRFTLNLIGASQNKMINEIEVGENAAKILASIALSYKKAPYFQEVFPLIESILEFPEKNLAKFIGNSLKMISAYLEIDTEFIYSSNLQKDNSLKAEEKILEICEKLDAVNYINLIGGQAIYSKENFQKHSLKLNFIKTEIVEYQQFKNEFIPYLSIIDIIMFNSKEEVKKMLNRYNLI